MPRSTTSAPKSKSTSEASSKLSKKRSVGAAPLKDLRRESDFESALNAFPRITRTPGVMGGKPCIKGSRMTVGMIVGQIGEGATVEEMMDDFPELKREDVLEAIRYAAWYSGDLLLDLDPAA